MFKDFSNTYIPMIDQSIKDFFRKKRENAEFEFIENLYSDLEEYCIRKGKRVRPLLLLLSYLGYSRRKDNLDAIIRIASILEMMHSFLLIQDDIIDNSLIRRGSDALHVVSYDRYCDITWNSNIGRDVAIVMGDILFSNALEIIGELRINPRIKDEFIKLFAKTYELTACGQILDSLHSLPVRIDINSPAPMQISALKTAHYTILSPMLMGFLLSRSKEDGEGERIREFSIPLGLAFQVRDDILGVFGSIEDTGKSLNSDIEEGKLTLLIQNTARNLKGGERDEFLSLFTKKKKTKREIDSIKCMIRRSGALSISEKKLGELIDTTRETLLSLRMKREEKDILSGFIDLITKL
ncbi:MAG: polyprenyl synthetase family protein [Spirochaetota bacterium]|nr:polyprenyl synthetase family protein [Spirochaetota bacterium]